MPTGCRNLIRWLSIISMIVLLGVAPTYGQAVGPQSVTWDALVPDGESNPQTPTSVPAPHPVDGSLAPSTGSEAFDPLGDSLLPSDAWDNRDFDVSEDLLNTVIVIDGYVLPLAWEGDRVVDFLLVPWVGACIHTPAPPPNQIIHVSYPKGLSLARQFEAVRLTGNLRLEPATHDLFLVDGRRFIPAAYALSGAEVAGTPGEVQAASAADLTLSTRAQIWANTVFTESMTAIGKDITPKALFFAIALSFVYGALHTLGPGHGKSVVISYFAGTGGSLRRGVAMGARIAVFHVLSAIVVVFVLDFAVRQTTGAAPSDYRSIRLGSYALIVAIGTIMLWQAVKAAFALKRERLAHHDPAQADHSGHGDHAGCAACAAVVPSGGGWIAASVGVVPCTGALLVMLFGLANDLVWPAILMVCAISAGMALAMTAIGVAALWGRSQVERRFSGNGARAARFDVGARLAGSACVLAVGFVLFWLTWSYQPLPQISIDDIASRENRAISVDG